MKSDKEFLQEIYTREERFIAAKKKQRKAIILSALPIVLCVAIIATTAIMPPKSPKNHSKSSSNSTVSNADSIINKTTTEGTDDVIDNAENCTDGGYRENSSQTHYPSQKGETETIGSDVNDSNKTESASSSIKADRLPVPNQSINTSNLIELTKTATDININATRVDEEFITANTEFYLKLLKCLNANKENVLVSPVSIVNALGMTANGASGETLHEMEKVISGGMNIADFNRYIKDYSGIGRSKVVKLANSIWLKNDDSIVAKKSFLNKCKGIYNAQVFKTDFNANGANQVNNWVSKSTNGKITKIIEEFNPNDAMLLINTTYFADTWMSMFDPMYDLKVKKFTNSNGEQVKVNMLHDRVYDYLTGENCVGFIKDYEHGYSFAALLPKKGMGTEEFLKSLTASELQSVLTNPQSAVVDIALPKFKVEYKTSLVSVLKKMGIKTPFSESAADFSEMANSKNNLYIDDVVHNTSIDLNEYGTVASAATRVLMVNASMPDEIKKVNLNRPFVYFIIDNATNLPIFCGTVNNLPAAK